MKSAKNGVAHCLICANESLEIVRIHSNHTFCRCCLERYAASAGTDSELHLKCPVRGCRFRFHESFIAVKGAETASLDPALIATIELSHPAEDFKDSSAAAVVVDSPQECVFCLAVHPPKTCVKLSSCDHFCCIGSLTQHAQKCEEDNKGIDGCVCPIKTCGKPISSELIGKIGETELANQLQTQTYRRIKKLVECPSCHKEFPTIHLPKRKIVQCPHCAIAFCKECFGGPHKGLCPTRAEMLKISPNEDEKIRACPYCLKLSGKDEKCSQVTCYECGNDFCFQCSAKWTPISVHGNHYHRKGCPNYAPFAGEDKMNEKCPECARLGKVCTRPKELVDNDIPIEEIPAELLD